MADMHASDGETVTLTKNAFTRTGYTFAGWTTVKNSLTGGMVYADGGPLTKGSDSVVLYAYWTANVNTLSFDANGGSGTMASQNVASDATITLPANTFTNGSNLFTGWALSSSGAVAYADKASFTMPTSSTTTLYAHWVAPCVVTFNSEGGTACASQSIAPGKLATAPTVPTYASHALEGWFTDTSYTKRWDFATDTVSADMTLYAKWLDSTDGLSFTLINGNTEYSVAKGSASSSSSITIPAYWNCLQVTAIADSGFASCSSLTSVTIPSDITTLGTYAFSQCSSLSSLTLPSGLTSIGDDAFLNCKKLTTLSIPSSVGTIGQAAFENCTGLTSISLPTSMSSLGNSAFYGCTGLTSITLPSGISVITEDLCYGCTALTGISIPAGVSSIQGWAFYQCTNLKTVSIPSGVTSIGQDAFSYCTSLTSLALPDSISSIGDYAFAICTKLQTITLPANITSIGNYWFQNCNALASLTIPSKVTSIGDFAFYNCLALGSLALPSGVTSIGSGSFDNCAAMTSITLSDGLVSIGNNAFTGCSGLTSLTLPAKVSSLGIGVFSGTTALTTLTVNNPTPPTSTDSYLFTSGYKVTKIAVPSASVATYKATSPWSVYSSIIVSQ